MSKHALSILFCFLLFGLVVVGCSSGDPVVNEIPAGEQLEQSNQAIAEVESEAELEN